MNAFDTPRTKTLRDLIEREGPNGTGRIVGLSIEGDGVFIYTNSWEWCDDSGSGTFRGDSETAAVRRFRSEVQRADASPVAQAEPVDASPVAQAEPVDASPASMAATFVTYSVHAPDGMPWRSRGASWRELAQNSAWRGTETQPGGPVRFPDGSMVTFMAPDGLPVEYVGGVDAEPAPVDAEPAPVDAEPAPVDPVDPLAAISFAEDRLIAAGYEATARPLTGARLAVLDLLAEARDVCESLKARITEHNAMSPQAVKVRRLAAAIARFEEGYE